MERLHEVYLIEIWPCSATVKALFIVWRKALTLHCIAKCQFYDQTQECNAEVSNFSIIISLFMADALRPVCC